MKTSWFIALAVAALVTVSPARASCADERPFHLGLGIGGLFCPGFHDFMSDLSRDGDAAHAWLNLNVSGSIRLNDSLAVVPALDLYANGNKNNQGLQNRMMTPSVNLRASFGSLYVQAGPMYTFASGGGDLAEFEGGVGFAGGAGYRFASGATLDLGYVHMPVEVTTKSRQTTSTEEFGGPVLRLMFWL